MSEQHTHEMREYKEAKAKFEEAEARAEKEVRAVPGLEARLGDWRRVVVVGTAVDFARELGTVNPAWAEFDAGGWPAGERVARAILDRRIALIRLWNAYLRLSDDEKARVAPPPEEE